MSAVQSHDTPVVADDLQSDLLVDCQNLANECQALLRSLAAFAFPNSGLFTLEHYEQFLRNKKVPDYLDWTRQLANKTHGLKGVLGFLIPDAKRLCHHMEELIKPLAQVQIVLDDRLHDFITRVIYEIQAMLEAYARNQTTAFDLGDWPQRIEQAFREAEDFIDRSGDAIAALLAKRGKDDGAIRKRDHVVHLSVAQDGYEQLVEYIHQLFSVVASVGNDTAVSRASRLYSAFLDQHQRIKKLRLDVSRYDRLVPSLAEKYGLRAQFVYLDTGVRANHEFWSAIHEISNHILKNAIIHGIETPLERVKADKSEQGRISLELSEDLLHIEIVVADDGRGIDPERIGRKAVEQGIVTPERLEQMTREEVFGLVFEQGVSTKEDVDDNAGRGIGMSAVREAMLHFQGTCRIESEAGQGTRWCFRFPKTGVSLPCFVTRVGSYPLVIPEAHVRFFANFDPSLVKTMQGRPVYQHGDMLVPMVDYASLFDADIEASTDAPRHLMVVQDGGLPHALLINQVIDKGILPIHPLSELGGDRSLFIGATLHQARPAMILAVRALDERQNLPV